MPARGSSGRGINPAKIKAAAARPAKPIAKLPGVTPKPRALSPLSTAHTGRSVVPGPKTRGLHLDTSTPTGRKTLAQGVRAARSIHAQSGALGPLEKGLFNTAAGTAKALVHNPAGTIEHTAGQVPKVFGAVGGQIVRTGAETIKGHPFKAAENFVGETVKSTKGLLGENLSQSQHEAETEGAANKLLLLAGGARAGGLAAGALERTVGSTTSESAVRKALAKSSTTVRPPIAHRDSPVAVRAGEITERAGRSGYSKDKGRAMVQKVKDAKAPKVTENGKPVMVEQLGRMVPVLKPRKITKQGERLSKRRADFESQRSINAGIRARTEQTKATAKIEKPGRGRQPVRGHTARTLAQLGAEAAFVTAKTFRQDAKNLREMWEGQLQTDRGRTPSELRTLKSNIALVKQAESNPKVYSQAEAIMAEAERHGRSGRALDTPLHVLGVAPKEQLDRAAMSTYAITQMGARHHTEEMHLQAERKAQAHEQKMAEHAVAAGGTDPQLNHWAQLAREHRIAVSGRNPEAVAAYEKIQQAAKDATAKRKTLERTPTKWEPPGPAGGAKPLHEINPGLKPESKVRIYRATPDREIHPGEGVTLERPTHGFAPHLNVISKEVPASSVFRDASAKPNQFGVHEYGYHPTGEATGGVSNHALEAARAKERVARLEAEKVKKPPITEALRTKEGKELTTKEIEDHARAAGRDPETITYVPHVASTGRKGAFYRPLEPGRRPTGETRVRTGAMLRRGELSINREVLHENRVGKATLAAAVQQVDQVLKGASVKPDGTPYTASGAREALRLPGNEGMVAVRLFSGSADKELQDIALARIDPIAGESFISKTLNDRLMKADEHGNTQNFALIPKARYDRLLEQATPLPKPFRVAQMGRKWFTFSVLAQPKWLLGQFLEPHVIRLTTNGAGINVAGSAVDFAAWRKTITPLLKSSDPAKRLAAEAIDSMAEGGLTGKKGRNIVRSHEDFPGSDTLYAAHVLRTLPVFKQFADLYVRIPETIFSANHYIERSAEQVSIGKSLRADFQELSGQWLRTLHLQGQALEDLQNGLVNTARQERYARELWTTLGKYDTYGPAMKALTSTIVPFVPWVLNSVRFVFWTMPAHHTGLFSATALAANQVQREWEAAHKMLVGRFGPSFTNAYIDKGKVYDVAKLLPTGVTDALAHGDFSELPGLIAPQIRGPSYALEGKDPFGRDFKVKPTKDNPKGKPSPAQIAGIFANQVGESTLWGPAIARRMEEGGGTPYANSTFLSPQTKPGTKTGEGPLAAWNPLKPVKIKAEKQKKAKLPRGLGSGLSGGLGGNKLGGGLK